MGTITQRRIRLTPDEKLTMQDYAFIEVTDISKMVRAKLEEYTAGGLDSIRLPRIIQTRPGTMSAEITFLVDNDLWRKAIAKAKSDGVQLSAIVRASIIADYRADEKERAEKYR